MIAKTFEWYRVVDPNPTPQAIEARTKAATDLTGALSKQDPKTLLAMVQGIVREFDGASAEDDTIEWLLRALKLHDPAISENLSENQMELRCIAAITLGELLLKSKGKISKRGTLAASALVSALYVRRLPKQRYLRAMLEELSALAVDVVETAADARRRRTPIEPLSSADFTLADLAATSKALSGLQSQITALDRNASMDREEISLFWFIAAGFSRTKKEAFSSIAEVGHAAVHAALELSKFVLIPASLNCLEILSVIVENKRKRDSLKPVSLKDHVELWTSTEWEAIAGTGSLDADFASKFPAILPVSWVANRMREGQSAPNWIEFQKMTGMTEDMNFSATQLARQLLWEKIVVSLAGENS
jgi:hypothetical protein